MSQKDKDLKIKIPPRDIQAEVSVLGSILLDKQALLKIADILKPEHFYDPNHSTIFASIIELFIKNKPIDLVTVAKQLQKNKKLTEIGGRAYLIQLLESVPTSAHIEEYAKIVKESGFRRNLISVAAKINEFAFEEEKEIAETLGKSQQLLFDIAMSGREKDFVHIKELLNDAMEDAGKSASSLKGLASGFIDLDKIIGGFNKSDLVILAARPSMGKTALALDFSLNIATKLNKKIAFFSLEMSKNQLMNRLLSMHAGVSLWKMNMGKLENSDWTKLSQAVSELSECNIFIDDTPGQNILDIRTKARRLHMEQQIDIIIIDYLQLVHGFNRENRVVEVSQVSQELKNLARELDVPVISLAQLSRKVEERADKMPQLSDLRDSGSIEQDADIVMFIHKEEYYNPETPRKGIADLRIAKHRNGPTGSIEIMWQEDQASFKNLTQEYKDSNQEE